MSALTPQIQKMLQEPPTALYAIGWKALGTGETGSGEFCLTLDYALRVCALANRALPSHRHEPFLPGCFPF